MRPITSVKLVDLPAVDLATVLAEDAEREQKGLPPRFAVAMPVHLSPDRNGTWETLPSGELLWRLRLRSAGALSLNLGFTSFRLPPEAKLFIRSADGRVVLGPFTDRDNHAHRQLWTPIVPGDELVVELLVAPPLLPNLELEVGSVNRGYRSIGEGIATRTETCYLDVVCGPDDGYPQVNAWRDQIRSVGVYTLDGTWNCSGALVNNTAEDLKPLFLTAWHCGVTSGNAPSMVVYWNYQSSTCRTVGSPDNGEPGDGSLAEYSTGATLRASWQTSDFTLVELDDIPDPAFELYWAGWDRSGGDSPTAVTIHHPFALEKRINLDVLPTQVTSYLGDDVPGDGTHVRVPDWAVGSLYLGSSGAPLLDSNHRVIGQLHATLDNCTNSGATWAGRLATSWTGGGAAITRLSDWLDPLGTGASTLDGLNGCPAPTFDFTVSPDPPNAGEPATFEAVNVTGVGPFTYAWDLDADGVVDCTSSTCTHTYPGYTVVDVLLTVTDIGAACSATVSHTVIPNASLVVYVSTAAATESCGDGDSYVEPGEEWTAQVTVANLGSIAGDATAMVQVTGFPGQVGMTQPQLVWPAVPPGGQATASFSFLLDRTFAPCGADIHFQLGPITWSGGSSPGQSDLLVVPTGDTSATVVAYSDDFSDESTWGGLDYPGSDKWSVTIGPGPHSFGEWRRVAPCDPGVPPPCALAERLGLGSSSWSSTRLTSPVLDLSGVASGANVQLELYMHAWGGEDGYAMVEVFDGQHWTWISSIPLSFPYGVWGTIDASEAAANNPVFQFRFSLSEAFEGAWLVDEVVVRAPGPVFCDNVVDCGRVTLLFADGFETADASAWTAVSP